jgi:hypothetical protein
MKVDRSVGKVVDKVDRSVGRDWCVVRRAIGALTCVIVIAAWGCARKQPPAAAPSPSPSPSPTVPMVASPLDGEMVPLASTKHRVAAVMIDNFPDGGRPQSGLRDADIVYEAEAEGGITRYLALFLEQTPAKIGPVRSARLYFVDLARPYAPYFAHAGENDDVWGPLKELREAGFADVEEIVGVGEAFWRDDSRDMPHNLYTKIALLRSAGPNHGWPDAPFAGSGFVFGDRPAGVHAPPVTVDFEAGYVTRFDDGGDGTYRRSIDGVVQHDLDDAAPYRVADVVAVWIPETVMDSLGDLKMDVYGDFPAVVIRNGLATTGTWSAPGPDAPPSLIDPSGDDILLAPGQIYIEVLPQGGSVTAGNQSWSY